MRAYGIYKHGLLCMYVHTHKYSYVLTPPSTYVRTYVYIYIPNKRLKLWQYKFCREKILVKN